MGELPELEYVGEEGAAEGIETAKFDHEAHMAKVNEGLQAILQSNNIQEVKAIAQSLLVEEQQEQVVEGEEAPGFREQALSALGGQSEA